MTFRQATDLLAKRGVSISELARRSSLARSSLMNWRSGKMPLRRNAEWIARKIDSARALLGRKTEITADELFPRR